MSKGYRGLFEETMGTKIAFESSDYIESKKLIENALRKFLQGKL